MVDLGPLQLTPEARTLRLRIAMRERTTRARRRRNLLTGSAVAFFVGALGFFLFVLHRR